MLDGLIQPQHILGNPIYIYIYISSMGSVESSCLTLLIPRVSKTSLVFREQKVVSTCIRLTWIDRRLWSRTNLQTLFSSRVNFAFKTRVFKIYYHKYCAFICALYDYMARTTSTTTNLL